MLSRPQQILLKRAQAQAGLSDSDYRLAFGDVCRLSGCRSSTDPRLMDEHLDALLSYFEAIYWRAVDAGELVVAPGSRPVFKQRGYWAARNQRGNTSRDRYTESQLLDQIMAAELALSDLGCGPAYIAAVRRKTGSGWPYLAALRRTLDSKQKSSGNPF